MTKKTAKSKQAPARTIGRTSKKQTSKNNKRTTGAKKFWKTFVICLLIELLVAIVAVGFYTYDRVMNYNIGGGDELSDKERDKIH